MLVGYVSDERYVALPGVELEFLGPGGSTAARSRASGAIHAELAAGDYQVVLDRAVRHGGQASARLKPLRELWKVVVLQESGQR